MLYKDSFQLSSAHPGTEDLTPSKEQYGRYHLLGPTEISSNFSYSNHNYTDEDYFRAEGSHAQSVSCHGIILTVAAGVGILSNFFIMFTILRHRKLRGSMSNVLLCHLCGTALAHCLILFPIYMLFIFSIEWYKHSFVCSLQGTLTTILSAATLLNLAAISVDKYRTIASPLRYSTRLNKNRLAVTCTIIWIPSVMLCVMPVAVGPGYYYEPAEAKCDIALHEKQSLMVRWGVSMPIILFMFYIPGSIILCCYSRMFCIARSHRKRIISMLAMVMLSFQAPITRNETGAVPLNEQKASKTIAVFLGTFFLFYIPYSLLALFELIFSIQINFYVALSFHIIHQLAPCINGIAYGSMNKSLRQTFTAYTRKLYSRHFLLTRWQTREIRVPTVDREGNNVTRV